jgi:thiamine-phosphate pyrophosphorylase
MSDNQTRDWRRNLARMACRLNARARSRPAITGLILMTDDWLAADWVTATSALPAGSAVIVRHRDARSREQLARTLLPACRRRRILLLIAEDFRLAMRVRADGVHVPEQLAHRIRGLRKAHAGWVITTSVHSLRARLNAERQSPHALLVSPLFGTSSHPGKASLGLTRCAGILSGSRVPSFALGGIDASNVSLVSGLPVQGIALIRGWLGADCR